MSTATWTEARQRVRVADLDCAGKGPLGRVGFPSRFDGDAPDLVLTPFSTLATGDHARRRCGLTRRPARDRTAIAQRPGRDRHYSNGLAASVRSILAAPVALVNEPRRELVSLDTPAQRLERDVACRVSRAAPLPGRRSRSNRREGTKWWFTSWPLGRLAGLFGRPRSILARASSRFSRLLHCHPCQMRQAGSGSAERV